MFHRASYRIGQALGSTFGRVDPGEAKDALAELPEALRPLFLSLRRRDQRHAIGVLRRLGPAPAVLRQAALLHDVGKARVYLGTPGRSLLVLARGAHATGVLTGLPWFGPRVTAYMRHPEVGAEMLRHAGASQQLVEIVAEHQEDEPRLQMTRLLQQADGRE